MHVAHSDQLRLSDNAEVTFAMPELAHIGCTGRDGLVKNLCDDTAWVELTGPVPDIFE